MSLFRVDCRMNCKGMNNDNFRVEVRAAETIDCLAGRATRHYVQRNFRAIAGRNVNFIDGWRIRLRPDTPHVFADHSRYPEEGSIRNVLNTCGELRHLLCNLNGGNIEYPPYLYIELEAE